LSERQKSCCTGALAPAGGWRGHRAGHAGRGALGRGSDDWAAYHGNGAGDHFSPLTQIDRSNVASLAPAWRIETGQGGLQTTPLVIDGVLYAMTPDQQVLAVDGATGREMWRRVLPDTNLQPVRGLSYWSMGASGACWWGPAAICMRSIRRRARQSPDLGIMAGWICALVWAARRTRWRLR
jgi:outer membrane protein assembly factor BamB